MTRISALIALGLFYLLPCLTSAVVDKWTPEGFDWDGAFVNTSIPSGIHMKADEAPHTTDLTNVLIQTDEKGVQIVPIAAFFGFAWRVASIAVASISLKNTVKTCKQTSNKEASVYDCVEGVLSTAVAFGGAASAAKQITKTARGVLFPHRIANNGLVDIELQNFPIHRTHPRELDAQLDHNEFVRHQLRSLSSQEPEFLGYAEEDHKLARREFGTHPLVPMFRFDHSEFGSMEITSRDTHNGTFFTLAHAGHSTHMLGRRQLNELHAKVKRGEDYDHQTLTGGAVEARFDADASSSDPATLSAQAGDLFKTVYPQMNCFMGQKLKDSSVLDVQMYDKTNHATFGFGTLGVYKNDDDANSIADMEPEGQPLPQCK
ncbi:hypothetical protein ACN42_g3875 [Penicillium freii]|uniref:Peptidase A1 domain-containing protein n=1 Tax=Penicillium freii TaxID=48697 RepID=A0A117NQ08_PENFR|nr:hypothetical protein ACN42_g3875 [Penicillium freii]